MMLMMKDKDEC